MISPYKIYFNTYGCRLNQYESDGLMQAFLNTGCFISSMDEESADFLVVNTCTVTNQADRRSLQWIRRMSKNHPQKNIIVTGCLAQTDPEIFSEFSNVMMVVGNDRKTILCELVQNYLCQSIQKANIKEKNVFAYPTVFPYGRTRGYLKIQDGCNKTCSYCKIPQARGRAVSRPLSEILEHVDHLEEKRIPEIVITGVNIGWYRDKESQTRFVSLLEKILLRLKYSRLRLSSIEPCDVDEPLAQVMRHPRFCSFLHVPVQSGSYRILRGMRRSYTPESYRKRLDVIRRYHSKIFIGTDVIIGFPSESNHDFTETMKLCADLQMANIHAFPYSIRQGTPAGLYGPKIPRDTVRERMQQVKILRKKLWENYVRENLGQKRSAIIEKIKKTKSGNLEIYALSDDFLRIKTVLSKNQLLQKSDRFVYGSFLPLRIREIDQQQDFLAQGTLIIPPKVEDVSV